jgi:hypothetical protein
MELISEFNEWLLENNFTIKNKNFDEQLIKEINEEHKFKSGGRNELDKYMKILITEYELMKGEEKVITYKETVTEFKKQKKAGMNKKIKKEAKKEDIKKERYIIVDETLNTKNLVLIERVESVIKEMIEGLLGHNKEKEWKITIAKNVYSLKIEDKCDEGDEKINLEIYGKKLIKRDIKLISDYLTKKRKIDKKTTIENTKKEKIKEEIVENKADKKKLYKELFGEETEDEIDDNIYKESQDIENLIVDLDDIKF